MSQEVVTARITFAWWVEIYLYLLAFFCELMQTEPDYEKVVAFMMHGVKVELVEES